MEKYQGKETRENKKEAKYQEELQEGKDPGKDTVVTEGSHMSIQEGAAGIMGIEERIVQMKIRRWGVLGEWEEEEHEMGMDVSNYFDVEGTGVERLEGEQEGNWAESSEK